VGDTVIVGIGADLCDIERVAGAIERTGQNFLDRVFTPAEQAAAQRDPDPPSFYAGRFAAKEACAKALGTGITDRVRWTDIEFLAAPVGQPLATLSGGALRRMRRLVGARRSAVIHVSISHEQELAFAILMIEAH
jgi:holo-[acyl-carrier protein] synthase